MAEIRTGHLFTVTLQVEASSRMPGATFYGGRPSAKTLGGKFEGTGLRGKALDGGGRSLAHSDRVFQVL